jgi:hypothetical protein
MFRPSTLKSDKSPGLQFVCVLCCLRIWLKKLIKFTEFFLVGGLAGYKG